MDSLILNIGKEIVTKFSTKSIINDFEILKNVELYFDERLSWNVLKDDAKIYYWSLKFDYFTLLVPKVSIEHF